MAATTARLFYIKAYRATDGYNIRHVVAQTIEAAMANAFPATYRILEARELEYPVLVVS